MRCTRLVMAFLSAVVALGSALAMAADKPRLPADKNQPAAAADGKRSLANDAISYAPPEAGEWIEAVKSKTPTRDSFVSKAHDAMIAIEVLPASMTITPDLAASMIKKIRENRKANAQKFVMEPTVEKDDRFVIRLHEKYQIKDKVADQLHLYRQVGPRVVLVTVNSLGGEEAAKPQQEAAEKSCLSAEFKGKK
jgi:hypothetical protein